MTKITVIYRCCEVDTKGPSRPKRFSKLDCLDNFLGVFKYDDKPQDVSVDIIAVHDGHKGLLYDKLAYNDIDISKINVFSNEKSLQYCLALGANIAKTDVIYFLEDDYLHTEDALSVLLDGFKTAQQFNKSNIISMYHHPDRTSRTDDIDRGKTFILLGETGYWRTAESTTCTWATTQDSYLNHGIYEAAKKFGLNDREFFRSIRSDGTILFNPIISASTHCHVPFMGHFVDWSNV